MSGCSLSVYAFTRVALLRLIHRIIGRQRKNGPDRQRKLERECLEISVTSFRSMSLGFWRFLIVVSTSRAAMYRMIHRFKGRQRQNVPDRQRELEPDYLGISATSCRCRALCFGIFLIRVGIYQDGSVSPYTSNYRTPKEKRA